MLVASYTLPQNDYNILRFPTTTSGSSLPNSNISLHRSREISNQFQEPLLAFESEEHQDNIVQYHEIWEMCKKVDKSVWIAEEIIMNDDKFNFDKLSDNEKHYIKYILAFLAVSNRVMTADTMLNFCCEIQNSEARCFYGFQMSKLKVHFEVYSRLIDTYIGDSTEKSRILSAILDVPCVKKKSDWVLKWSNKSLWSFAERIVAFIALEGVFYSGSFCSVLWLKHRGLLPGFCAANDMISRDGGMHLEFACLIYSKLINKLPQSRIFEIVGDAVKIESEFVKDALPVELIGMNSTLMKQYIQHRADLVLQYLRCQKLYKVENPFNWMEKITCQIKSSLEQKQLEKDNENYQVFNYKAEQENTLCAVSFADF